MRAYKIKHQVDTYDKSLRTWVWSLKRSFRKQCDSTRVYSQDSCREMRGQAGEYPAAKPARLRHAARKRQTRETLPEQGRREKQCPKVVFWLPHVYKYMGTQTVTIKIILKKFNKHKERCSLLWPTSLKTGVEVSLQLQSPEETLTAVHVEFK